MRRDAPLDSEQYAGLEQRAYASPVQRVKQGDQRAVLSTCRLYIRQKGNPTENSAGFPFERLFPSDQLPTPAQDGVRTEDQHRL